MAKKLNRHTEPKDREFSQTALICAQLIVLSQRPRSNDGSCPVIKICCHVHVWSISFVSFVLIVHIVTLELHNSPAGMEVSTSNNSTQNNDIREIKSEKTSSFQ